MEQAVYTQRSNCQSQNNGNAGEYNTMRGQEKRHDGG